RRWQPAEDARRACRPRGTTLPREASGINDVAGKPLAANCDARKENPAAARGERRPGTAWPGAYRPSVARPSFGCISVAATQHEITHATVRAHMEMPISNLPCLARSSTRLMALSSSADIGKM